MQVVACETTTYLSDCNTAFIKQVFPRLRKPDDLGRVILSS